MANRGEFFTFHGKGEPRRSASQGSRNLRHHPSRRPPPLRQVRCGEVIGVKHGIQISYLFILQHPLRCRVFSLYSVVCGVCKLSCSSTIVELVRLGGNDSPAKVKERSSTTRFTVSTIYHVVHSTSRPSRRDPQQYGLAFFFFASLVDSYVFWLI